MSAGSFLVRLLWPDRCAACSVAIIDGAVFCAPCEATVLPIDSACPGCALPREPGDPVSAEGLCPACRDGRFGFGFTGAMACLLYGGAVADAIVRFKHGRDVRQLPLARGLGRCLVPLLDWAARAGVDAILPVPLHPARLRQRGFNQSLELVREARRRRAGSPLAIWSSALVRRRDTAPLGHDPPAVRAERLGGAFAVPSPARVQGRRLLVVDDVMTTGATLAECARTLLGAGAKEILVGALARAARSDHHPNGQNHRTNAAVWLAPRVPP